MKISILLLTLLLSLSGLAQERKKVACIGNSVTYGYLHNNPAETSYPTQLQQMLGDSYDVRNFGKSGATLLNKGHRPYTLQAEYNAALEFKPDIAVIHLGLNDTDPRNWPNYRDEFIPDYLALIDTLRALNPKVEVIVCQMTPIFHWHRRFKSGTRDWYHQINATIADVARIAGCECIDLGEELYKRPNLMPDALHPNPAGATLIAERVYSAITGDFGGLKLPAIYSDNMVIQRDVPFTVAGSADTGSKVIVRLDRHKKSVTVPEEGKWQVTFAPLKADGKSHTLSIECNGKSVTYNNIAIGEVWLCSGQSNMAFMVKESSHKEQSLANIKGKDIRLYNMKPRVVTNPVEWPEADLIRLNEHEYYLPTEWQLQNEQNVSDFSVVAYHFGAMLADSLQVPIGLICNAIGGAPAEAYIDRRTLEFHPTLVDILYHWRENDMVQYWCRERASKNIAKGSNKLQRHPYEPCYLYETGIAPLAIYPIKGAIWYQGESNAHNIELHEIIFPTLIDSWRKTWNNPAMPFYFVQLSSINRPSWPHFRDSQRRMAQAIPHCDFAVASDKGHPTDVHPKEKAPIGERLARLALNSTYGMNHVAMHGPVVESATRKGGNIILQFKEGDTLTTSDGTALRGFETSDKAGVFVPASGARIKGNTVIIPADKRHTRVRYAWKPYTDANLINGSGLPASTFEIEVEQK